MRMFFLSSRRRQTRCALVTGVQTCALPISKRIAAAFLDVTTPEPLPADDPLWSLDNAHVTMHLSGRAQDKMFVRAASRFLENLSCWHRGEPVAPQVDLTLGY